MIARIELGEGAPAELVRLLPLLGLEPIPLGSVPDASIMASDSATVPDLAGFAAAPTGDMAVALRVEFGMYRGKRAASPTALTIAIVERDPALDPIAETAAATADFVCDCSIAAACFILARALRLASPILTTNARLFEVIRAAVAIAHGPAGVLVEGEIGVGKESLIKMIHAASGDPASLIYAECAGLEAASVAAEIAPLLAQAAGPARDADPDYDVARLPGGVRHDADGSDDAHNAGDANSKDRLHRDDAIGSARGASRADDLNCPTGRANDLGRPAIPLGGTIFFNHLGELPLAAQRKLLDLLHPSVAGTAAITDFQSPADRALATPAAAPVVQGAAQNPNAARNPGNPAVRAPVRRPPDSLNVRLLAASAQPLAAMVARGEFLAELQQLFDATLTITPLRDRPGDLPMLVRHALRTLNPAVTLDAAAIRTLARYPFPGNLRELTNFVTRIAIVPAKPITRRLLGSAGESGKVGRAEVIRQLDHSSLKLLWRSRTQAAARSDLRGGRATPRSLASAKIRRHPTSRSSPQSSRKSHPSRCVLRLRPTHAAAIPAPSRNSPLSAAPPPLLSPVCGWLPHFADSAKRHE